jgi:hypothetical protein
VLIPGLRIIESLRTSYRLTLLVALLLTPALVATWAFAGVIDGQIAFGTAERAGVSIVAPAVYDLVDVVAGKRPDLTVLSSAVAAHPELGAAQLAKVNDAVSAGAAWTPADRFAVATALSALVTQVANSSNLILDTDLDSFYVMDAGVVQLPNSLTLISQSATASAGPRAGADQAVRAGGISAAAQAMTSDTATADKNAARASLAHDLAPVSATASALTTLSNALSAGVNRPGPLTDGQIAPVTQVVGSAVRALTTSLDALLAVRIATLTQRRNLMLALVAGGLLLAVYTAAAVWWRTRSDVAMTVAGMAAMAGGDLSAKPLPTGRDEYGEIARSLQAIRDGIVRCWRRPARSPPMVTASATSGSTSSTSRVTTARWRRACATWWTDTPR